MKKPNIRKLINSMLKQQDKCQYHLAKALDIDPATLNRKLKGINQYLNQQEFEKLTAYLEKWGCFEDQNYRQQFIDIRLSSYFPNPFPEPSNKYQSR